MEEIKSVRVRIGDSPDSDIKVILYQDGDKKRTVNGLSGGLSLGVNDYRGRRYRDMSDNDIIADYLYVMSTSGKISTNYEIIQDPWLDKVPTPRRFGSDAYYLNNGTRLLISWTTPNSNEDHFFFGEELGSFINVGGYEWSDQDGNELPLPSGVSPTQSYYDDGDVGDGNGTLSYQSIKQRIVKTLSMWSPDGEEETSMSMSDENLIELSRDLGQGEKREKKYSGNISDIDIINEVLSVWNKKVPNYNLGICEPNNESCNIIEYKSPIIEQEYPEENGLPVKEEPVKKLYTFNVEREGVFIPITAGTSSGTSSVTDSVIGELTLLEEGAFVFQEEFDQGGFLAEEFTETSFDGEEEPEDSYIEPEIAQAADTFEKTTTYTPSGKYDLDLIPGTYLDNNKNAIKLCRIDSSLVNVKIAEQYLQMRDAAKAAGINLRINSAFRSPFDGISTKSSKGKSVSASSQDYLYTSYQKQKAGLKSYVYNGTSKRRKGQTIKLGSFNLAAKAGTSNHGSGIGLDFNTGGNSKKRFSGVNRDIYVWLVKNSWKFGFVRAVSKEEWHFDYLPNKAKLGPYGKLGGGKSQKDTSSVSTKFYSKWGLDSLQSPNWGSTVNLT